MRGLLISFFIFLFLHFAKAQLRVGFYSTNCPTAESAVRAVIRKEVTSDPKKAVALLRLQFHDCFVQGYDGSILLRNDSDETVVQKNVGEWCPGVVSRADIIALVARDAVFLSNGPLFEVPTSRRDGRVSKAEDAENLPDSEDTIKTLKAKFDNKGLTEKNLVNVKIMLDWNGEFQFDAHIFTNFKVGRTVISLDDVVYQN
ncbi:hypothetical protein ARALYDRAFT_351860 [Arabidopsis lyrata subsp. lyrata]|uniref:peroxidase n=1 Tax=Arabidopsis lyrata subsp. lyrata TaxID=81972 RepID=D7M7J1_ARALL|nr:hypothetical protein ARALYDRAFT_351860 [Arabidopsis lyrata subsp. lyrata]